MLRATAPIRPLPPDVAAQIKSSIAITSLSNAVLGLAFNSLDARAKHVEIMVDFRLGTCCVEDDGFGIPTNEFEESGGLGKIHRKIPHLNIATCIELLVSRYFKI